MQLLHTSALDVIQILGLTARGRHGVYPSERANGQSFSVDVTMHVDTRAAATDDDLSLTVDYSAVAEDVVEILSGNPVYLIETLAQRVAEAVLEYESVQIVEVKVHKPNAPMDLKFSDVSMTIRRTRKEKTQLSTPLSARADKSDSTVAVIGLGANLGVPWQTLARAVIALDSHESINVTAVSGLFVSAPLLAPDQSPQPEYYNAVAQVHTTLTPQALLEAIREIEDAHGRERHEHWGARTLDLDIIAVDGVRLNTTELTIPHPRAHERAFVLLPWVQINPEATLGKRGRVKVLAEQVVDQEIRSVADVWVEQALSGEYPGTDRMREESEPQDTPEPAVEAEPQVVASAPVVEAVTAKPVAAARPLHRKRSAPMPEKTVGDSPLFTRLEQSRKEAAEVDQATEESAPTPRAESAESPPTAQTPSLPRPGKRSARRRQSADATETTWTQDQPGTRSRIRIIDDIDVQDEVRPSEQKHPQTADSDKPNQQRRPVMKVDLPDTMERGLLPIDDEPTGPIPRSAVRPTVTGAIPIIRRSARESREDT